MGERFPVTAVTSVTETPVRPCEAVCAAFSGWADKVTHNWRYRPRSAFVGQPTENHRFGRNGTGCRNGETPTF